MTGKKETRTPDRLAMEEEHAEDLSSLLEQPGKSNPI